MTEVKDLTIDVEMLEKINETNEEEANGSRKSKEELTYKQFDQLRAVLLSTTKLIKDALCAERNWHEPVLSSKKLHQALIHRLEKKLYIAWYMICEISRRLEGSKECATGDINESTEENKND